MYDVTIYTPETLIAALKLKSTFKKDIVPLAGGTDILVGMRNKRPQYSNIYKLLSLAFIEDLRNIYIDENYLHIGATATHSDVISSYQVNTIIPSLAKAVYHLGSPQIRNQATVVGNICNASPAGDAIPTVYTADATITIQSEEQKIDIPIDQFIKGPGKIELDSKSIVTSVNIPIMKGYIGDYVSLRQRESLSCNKVSVASLIKLSEEKVIEDIRIALGAVAPTILRVTDAEQFLLNKSLTEDNIIQAAEISMNYANAIDDLRSTKEYRKAMVNVLTQRILKNFLSA